MLILAIRCRASERATVPLHHHQHLSLFESATLVMYFNAQSNKKNEMEKYAKKRIQCLHLQNSRIVSIDGKSILCEYSHVLLAYV